MIIYRNGIAIELTAQETKAAYEEWVLYLRMEDAEIHFKSWCDYEELKSNPAKMQEFIDSYGYTPDDAMDGNSEAYAMKVLAEMFIDQFDRDCNTDENSVWRDVLDEFLESERRHHEANSTLR